MSQLLSTLGFALQAIAPVCIIVAIGWLLRRTSYLNPGFLDETSRLVYDIALPAFLFFSLAGKELSPDQHLPLILLASISLALVFVLVWLGAKRWIADHRDRAAFAQGSGRGNLAVAGLAFSWSAYGEQGVATSAMLVAVLAILNNLFSVYIVLGDTSTRDSHLQLLLKSLRSPLFICGMGGLLLGMSPVKLPQLIQHTGEMFTSMAIPLALLCVGASLNSQLMREFRNLIISATLIKILAMPLFVMLVAMAVGVRGMELGILVMLFGAPTASISVPLVQVARGNVELAAGVVIYSTFACLPVLSLLLVVLRLLNLI